MVGSTLLPLARPCAIACRNDLSNARLTFEQMAEDLVQDTIETNLQLYKALNDHPEAHAKIFDGMWERVLNRIRATMGGDQAA